MLDQMHYRGLVRIAGRTGGTRLYAVREATPPPVDPQVAMDMLVDVIVRKYAPLPERSLAERRLGDEVEAERIARTVTITPTAAAPVLDRAGESRLQHGVPIVEVAKRQKVSLRDLFIAAEVGASLLPEAVITADLELKYAGYFARERNAAARLGRMGAFALPEEAPYEAMHTVSVEARQKLAQRRPGTLAQAASIPGVSPADLQNLVLEVERWRRG